MSEDLELWLLMVTQAFCLGYAAVYAAISENALIGLGVPFAVGMLAAKTFVLLRNGPTQ